MSIVGDQEGGEDAAHYGRRVEAALRDPTTDRCSMSYFLPEGDVAAASTKLRLYREYSIKLMLAWETCCRSRSPSLYPFPL